MLTSLLWVALIAGAPDESQTHSAVAEFLALTKETIAEVQATPDVVPPTPEGTSTLPDLLTSPDPKATRSPAAYETSPGPAMQLETGRTPSTLR